MGSGSGAGAVRLGVLEPLRGVPEVLVLEQPPDQLRARVLDLALVVDPARQQHAGLDPDQRRRHLQELPRPVQVVRLHAPDGVEELVGDLRDGDVEDLDVLRADQVQEEVQRAVESLQLDDERLRSVGLAEGERPAFLDEIEGGAAVERGPFLLLVRHASVIDTLLPMWAVANPHAYRPRYAVKQELRASPCLDIAGHRVRTAFVRRGEGAREIERVAALAEGPVTGTALAERLDVTRAAVWKPSWNAR